MRILPCGPAARLLETADPVPLALGLRAAAQRDEIPAIIDLVVAEATVLIRCVSDISDRALARVQPMPFTPADGDLVNIPVVYDGPDLAEVARHVGVTADDVVHIHAGTTYRAEFCGFAPGFVYLSGIDPRLHLPRRHTPRTRVPAGSIALAAGYTAVYPLSTPGGWHLLGHTNIAIFDPRRDEPSLLRAGMRVRFHPVDSLPEPSLPAVAALCDADDAVAEVLSPGPLTLIQDLGRPGHGESAVGASGAFDRRAHRLANRIVGNSETAATLE
ncbi:MAG: 5-oxoprolinase subunit PxpB, partial [Candidatus Nanopelagicales bacterium]|nr:5-oxoprolinase subunit PxpB [Candidatus Nanopelagicales bacterium]